MADVFDDDMVLAPRRAATSQVVRRAVFCVVAAFIYLGPAPGQLFGQHSGWLREWTMFSGVGIGIPDGTFTVQNADGTIRQLKPLEAAGLVQYPRMPHYQFAGRVFVPEHLATYAAALCDTLPPESVLSFEGRIGTRTGWDPMQADDICTKAEAEQ